MSYALSLFIVLLGPLVDPQIVNTPSYRESLKKVLKVVSYGAKSKVMAKRERRRKRRPSKRHWPTDEEMEPQGLRPIWETDPTFPCPREIPPNECASTKDKSPWEDESE